MQYFIEEATHWDAPPKLFKAASDGYKAHLMGLKPYLSAEMREVAETDLQDGIIRQVVVDRPRATVLLRLRCGCFQDPQGRPVGYYDLDIHYQGAVLSQPDVEALKVAGLQRVEVLYDEIDREADGSFVHRFLCSGDFGERRSGQMAVRFQSLRLDRTPREQRYGRLGWPRLRYIEVPP